MKYDLSKKPTRGATRTLKAFAETMFVLLTEKAFEDISVNEISQRSEFPRATFYNYFDDKEDLLNYCWYVLSKEIKLEDYESMPPTEIVDVYFDRIYNLLTEHHKLLQQIMENNKLEGMAIVSFLNYFKVQARKIVIQFCDEMPLDVPPELVADHYCNTIMLVLEWAFLRGNEIDLNTAHQYLDRLIHDERKSEG
ncbi:TetR/AcrR family transcriptional regulator [Lentilactobacillus sp. Marseille-Q4993]|uniref:TetR/AcrR family transcriptional regulator n=1 Tax=Lentilactobacillus sp. Marseille-Q4993 TaxID=3039492 RepID=UPI0024BC1A1B|nr:TetR/AcrR family transcriptional regulator [Lentilactobacillus sp. Marseille-Q4993]